MNRIILRRTHFGCDICSSRLVRIDEQLLCPESQEYWLQTFGKRIVWMNDKENIPRQGDDKKVLGWAGW